MEQTELILFVVILNVVFLLLAGSVVYFIIQYRKRKTAFVAEKSAIEKQHKLDLLATKVDTQHQVMHFIGREIHDHVAQRLTLASLYAKMYMSGHAEASAETLQKITSFIDGSLLELRDLSRTLTNDTWQRMSLGELIQYECELVNATGITKGEFESLAEPDLTIDQKINLLRTVQEFIQNTLKHAAATSIRIVMEKRDQSLVLNLSDNGSGFNIDSELESGSGLQNMKRRMLQIGGSCQLISSTGKGTTLTITIPIA